jgi:hypothetical protein
MLAVKRFIAPLIVFALLIVASLAPSMAWAASRGGGNQANRGGGNQANQGGGVNGSHPDYRGFSQGYSYGFGYGSNRRRASGNR